MIGCDTFACPGHIQHTALSYEIGQSNSINCITGFKIMNRSIDMRTGMGTQMHIANQILPPIFLMESGMDIPWIYKYVITEWARDIKNFHDS
jgi:hypothetical protein